MRKAKSVDLFQTTGDRLSQPTLTSHGHFIHRSYKYRIYPNDEQKELLEKHFGCCRFVYNHFLATRKSAYESDRKTLSLFETHHMCSNMKKMDEFSWLNEVYSHALQASLKNLDCAYQKFFRKTAKFPRFHSKRDKQSVTFPDNVKVVDGKLKLPKFKTAIDMVMHRPMPGTICHATVSKTRTGKYFVSFSCVEECEFFEETVNAVGIDLGIKEMAVCSNGERIANPKFLERGEKHLKYLQRQVSRKKKGSNNRNRARRSLSRFHEKVANRRNDYIHKFTTRIVRENQAICVEDLNVKGMESNHHLAKSIASVSFGEIVRQLGYKSAWYGRSFVKVERFYPSSKTCNHCGHINRELTLKDREWTCKSCGETIDRDFNAALNIRDRGIEILSGDGLSSDVKQKHEEASQLCESMNHGSPRNVGVVTRGQSH